MIQGNKKVPSNHPLRDSQGINEHCGQFWLPRNQPVNHKQLYNVVVSRARRSLWVELAGREKERLVAHVNIPQRLCQDSGKTTIQLCVKLLPIIMIWRAVRMRRMEEDNVIRKAAKYMDIRAYEKNKI